MCDEQEAEVSHAERLRQLGIDVVSVDSDEYQSPRRGGCWICCTDDGRKNDSMEFSLELDTWYHQECLDKTGFDSLLEYEREF